jgi:L,D-peptidoglycan transpeptidase YkuD (ErfK/YbiS/YcfS/YnhG family)
MIVRAFADGVLRLGAWSTRCALGRSGVTPALQKREGDGASPAGVWPMRQVLYRPDAGPPPQTRLETRPIAPDDGWCDASEDPAYNRPVRLPYPASAEAMWRCDPVYDIVVVLGHNDDPVIPGAGSAIFFHLARPDWAPTEGCVAVTRRDMEHVLSKLGPGAALEICAGQSPGAENG